MQDNKRFDEQEAPQKNTDHAYVKVGEDGKPEMPAEDKNTSTGNNELKDQEGSKTTIEHR